MAWDHSTLEDFVNTAIEEGRGYEELEPLPTFSVDMDAQGELVQLRRVLIRNQIFQEYISWDSIFHLEPTPLVVCSYSVSAEPWTIPPMTRMVVGGGHCQYQNFPLDEEGNPIPLVEYFPRDGRFRISSLQPSKAEWAEGLQVLENRNKAGK